MALTAAERHYEEVKDDIGQLESFIDTYPGLDVFKEGTLKEEAIEQLQKLADQQWERRDTPTGRRLTAAARLEAAQAAKAKADQGVPSRGVDVELERAKKAYDALLGRRIEGVGGRFGQATPPKGFKGKVGYAPEDLAVEEAKLADILGSRAFAKASGSEAWAEPSLLQTRRRGRSRAEVLQEQIAQR